MVYINSVNLCVSNYDVYIKLKCINPDHDQGIINFHMSHECAREFALTIIKDLANVVNDR